MIALAEELNIGEYLDILLLSPKGCTASIGTITTDSQLQLFNDFDTGEQWTKECIRMMVWC